MKADGGKAAGAPKGAKAAKPGKAESKAAKAAKAGKAEAKAAKAGKAKAGKTKAGRERTEAEVATTASLEPMVKLTIALGDQARIVSDALDGMQNRMTKLGVGAGNEIFDRVQELRVMAGTLLSALELSGDDGGGGGGDGGSE
jgi:hypothetical protein